MPNLTVAPLLPGPSTDVSITQRLRVRWENLAIAGVGGAVAVAVAVAILASGGDDATSMPAGARAPGAHDGLVVAEGGGEAATLEQSRLVVAEAMQLIDQGSFDEAADRLATIPQHFREGAGADATTAVLDARRARHAKLRAELAATVEARRWSEADTLLGTITALAPLDAELRAIQAQVRHALAAAPGDTPPAPVTEAPPTDPSMPPAATTVTTAAPAPAATTVTKPTATTATPTRPAAATTERPAQPVRPAVTAIPTAGAGVEAGTLDLDLLIEQLGIELTSAQRAELESAVRGVLASGSVAQLQTALDGVIESAEIARLEQSLQGIGGSTAARS